ncbi:MAG: CpsD/CapB family tyrosine-protein kinase [Desulfobacterales bacterium]|nr:CpsD/CapB family tyrosine-protein kinase [Desulfobacterales bacterium]
MTLKSVSISRISKANTIAKPVEASEKSTSHAVQKKMGGGRRFSDLPLGVRHQFEQLKSSIILGSSAQRIKSILFTSYNHGEGTSTVIANFAESLVQDRKYKILMVDANTRSPALHQLAGVNNPDDNLVFSDMLTQQIAESDLPKPSPTSNLSLVPCGSTAYHPSQIFDHTKFSNFINRVTKLFDFVIFDSSPVGKYYDPVILASHVDGVILVVQAEKTPFHELKRANQILQDGNIPILGAVLNRRRFYIPQVIFERFLR